MSIAPGLLQIQCDDMAQVFDYDRLLVQISQIAGERHYTTQEYLLTRIVVACAADPQIEALDAQLRKSPVQGGSVGVRLVLGADELADLRATHA